MSTPAQVQSVRDRLSSAVLCASALVIVGLIITQLGRLTGATPASASMLDIVAAGGDYVMLTADAGSDDVLLVLDQRGEELLVYRTVNQQRLEFRARQSVRDLFFTARQAQGASPLPVVPGKPDTAPGAPVPNQPR